MNRYAAFLAGCAVVVWLFARARERHPMTSPGLWVVFVWITIIGSRPISLWFGAGVEMNGPADSIDGSPVDRAVYALIIVATMLVLLSRKIVWRRILSGNLPLVIVFVYFGLSIMWSEYPFVALKRWTKDLGNVMVVLILVTERDPAQAVRAVLLRFAYVVVPMSVVFIKYFPEAGRYFDMWTWQPMYCGITTNKNELGAAMMVSGLILAWDFLESRSARRRETTDVAAWTVLCALVAWLVAKAGCSTCLVCLVLSVALVMALRVATIRARARYLGAYSLAVALVIVVVYSVPGLFGALLGLVGRDMTLTGRTELWTDLLNQSINPILGEGYQSFWLGPGGKAMWDKYFFHPTQAHNAYLETYLNGGLVGVFLIVIVILATGHKLRDQLMRDDRHAILRFAFLVVAVINGWTEAIFNGLSIVWMIFLVATLNGTRSPSRSAVGRVAAAPDATTPPTGWGPRRLDAISANRAGEAAR